MNEPDLDEREQQMVNRAVNVLKKTVVTLHPRSADAEAFLDKVKEQRAEPQNQRFENTRFKDSMKDRMERMREAERSKKEDFKKLSEATRKEMIDAGYRP